MEESFPTAMEDDKEMMDVVVDTNSDKLLDDAADMYGHPNVEGTEVFSLDKETDDNRKTSYEDSNVDDILDFDSKPLAISHLMRRPLESPDAQIRLLWLHPGDPEDEIHCTLSTWTLGKSPEFCAISYTWGPSTPEAAICLWASADSSSAERHVLKVRENARYALWQVRRRCPGSFVWIDSVCIDQENLKEKGAQVAIMSEIYSNAHQVFACIGPADESSDAIKEACRDPDGTIQDTPDDWDSFAVYKNSWKPPKGEANLLDFVDHWETFSNRSYFHRLWIVQELYAGRDRLVLLCGNYTLNWSCLMGLHWRLNYWFNTWAHPLTSREESCSEAIGTMNRLVTPVTREDGLPIYDFENLLRSTHGLECDDPRDRVYGILGVMDWARFGVEKPVPNYDISPFDLALSLIPLTGIVPISLASVIIEATGFQYSMEEEEQIELLDGIRSHWIGRATSRTSSWYTGVHGLCLVQQDSHGRLALDLEQRITTDHDSRVLQLLHTSPETLGDLPLPFGGGCRPVELYTGDEVSVLAWPQVRRGDIILQTHFFDVVLRRSDVDPQFYVVGKALFLNGYRPKIRENWTCGCWGQEANSKHESVYVAISGVSDVDVLIYTAFDGFMHSSSHVQQLSLDFPPLGSVVRNFIPAHQRSNQLIRPLETSCTVHDAAQCNHWRHDGLLFAIASGCGALVQVHH